MRTLRNFRKLRRHHFQRVPQTECWICLGREISLRFMSTKFSCKSPSPPVGGVFISGCSKPNRVLFGSVLFHCPHRCKEGNRGVLPAKTTHSHVTSLAFSSTQENSICRCRRIRFGPQKQDNRLVLPNRSLPQLAGSSIAVLGWS